MQKFWGAAAMIAATLLWGFAFSAQSSGMRFIEPVVFTALPFLLFCGVGSGAIAFTLQMVCQKYLHPVTATLLMSLESVFAVLGGWIYLNEVLTPRELSGCAVIFLAVILSQLPVKPGLFRQSKVIDNQILNQENEKP